MTGMHVKSDELLQFRADNGIHGKNLTGRGLKVNKKPETR
jgi:hypothetical protein